jgi:alpha-glucosidase (family GH31 glycosyl hydrolase)
MPLRARFGTASIALALGLALAPAAGARSDVVRADPARFEVLTPTLIRLEFAQDRRFDDAPTMTTAGERRTAPPRFSVRRGAGVLTIRTGAMTLRYRLASGPFTTNNLGLTLRIGGRASTVHPTAANPPGNLGGWRRGLDLLSGRVSLNDGILSRAGWYVLDDTTTALITGGGSGFAVRPAHAGPYQDWYLFAYGQRYATGLEDLRALTGPAPLLPRSAFGVWFSRYWPYSEQDYHTLIAQFRGNHVPLDTLSIDTDFKRESNAVGAAAAAIVAGAPGKPYSWDGWEWDPTLFGDPQRFVDWAHSQGLSIALNIHPSISTNDPAFPQATAAAGGLQGSNGLCRVLIADPTAQCAVFDWADPRQAAAYFALHQPFEREGVDLFWLDWCCDASSAVAPGLTADTWINSLYAREQRARGSRWPAFARVGASYSASDGFDGDTQNGGTGIFAEHRNTIQFTGDTCATWPMLGFEAQFTAGEGNVGLPYVSHDIGSFNGQPEAGQCSAQTGLLKEHLPDDLYARWVAFGTFQPLDRLHSNHGDRLPWEYGASADAAAAEFLRLREALNPYLYTLARDAYDTGLPIVGALYLQWPGLGAAYEHPSEYTFGPDMAVEPVTASGDPAPATIWVPPGRWVDYFTGARFRGPRTVTLSVPLSQLPVLVRTGSIVPTQPYVPYTPESPPKTVVLTVYEGSRGSFRLYDDQGAGFGYERGAFTRTPIVYRRRGMRSTLTIGPARGRFPGAPTKRSWVVRFVPAGGRGIETVTTGPEPTDRRTTVTAP